MIGTIVSANVRHRPIRTVLSTLLIAVPVTLILTLVGLSHGFVDDSQRRTRGVGADIIVRAPDAAAMTFSSNSIPEALVARLGQVPHVAISTGIATHPVSGWTAVNGIDVPAFTKMSGGFVFVEGHGFRKPDDVLITTYYADQIHKHAGDRIQMLNRDWTVAGVAEPGKLANIFVPLGVLQELDSSRGKVSQIYLKLDDPKNLESVKQSLQELLPAYHIYSLQEMLSLTSADSVPFLKAFINVIIGVGVIIGFAVVSLSMYMAVLQRTREIGILKSLGGSRFFILEMIMAEALILGLGGTLFGILFSYGTRFLLMRFVPASLPQAIVPEWWPIAGAIVMGAAMLGALYPGWIAVRQDPIEALAYE